MPYNAKSHILQNNSMIVELLILTLQGQFYDLYGAMRNGF
jgi:hypothetical protein